MKDKTSGVVSIALLGLLAYEVYTLANAKKKDTISESIWRYSRRPLIPFVIGALASHFVWQGQNTYETYWKDGDVDG